MRNEWIKKYKARNCHYTFSLFKRVNLWDTEIILHQNVVLEHLGAEEVAYYKPGRKGVKGPVLTEERLVVESRESIFRDFMTDLDFSQQLGIEIVARGNKGGIYGIWSFSNCSVRQCSFYQNNVELVLTSRNLFIARNEIFLDIDKKLKKKEANCH